VVWADALGEPIELKTGVGMWSPTADEYLFASGSSDTFSDEGVLQIAAAPEFLPVSLTAEGYYDDWAWTSDGDAVVYFFVPDGPGSKNLYLVKRDGSDAHAISDDVYGNTISWLGGWLDRNNLVYVNYAGGGHRTIGAVNVFTGERKKIDTMTYGGNVYGPHNSYIPATNMFGYVNEQTLLVVSERFPYASGAVAPANGYFKSMPEFRNIPNERTISLFDGWQGSTNQMLVYWGYFSEDLELQGTHLLLWNVDTNAVRLLAPNGIGGRFSPDGKYLTYLTFGPAQLDADAKPVEYAPDGTTETYLQLMDMADRRVVLSLLAISDEDWDDSTGTHQYVRAGFSPDGRYLAFFTPGPVQIDEQGRSVVVEEPVKTYLNLLDLQNQQLVWSASAETRLSWSPTSQYLIFQDSDQNLQLLDVSTWTISAITLENRTLIGASNWSFDGRYLSLVVYPPEATNPENATTIILDLGVH
jgi:Tol biopolymer transport system component